MSEQAKEKLERYYTLTHAALVKAQAAPENLNLDHAREDFLDMTERYVADAKYFEEKGDLMTALAALSYAHGWLDAGARLGLWDVGDSRLFTVDDKPVP